MDITMYGYYRQQGEVLRNIVRNNKSFCRQFSELYKKINPDRLYIIASGSSLNAVLAASEFMEWVLGIEIISVASSEKRIIRGERPLLLFVSQGGNSTNTIRAIQHTDMYPQIALTGNEECRINEMCPHMSIQCGEELAGQKTKGYTSTLMMLCLMALNAAKEAGSLKKDTGDKILSDFAEISDNMESYLEETEKWYERNKSSLKGINSCVVVGKHIAGMVAKEGALKLQETILVPTGSYEFEEFLHGPSMAISRQLAGIYMMPEEDDPDYRRMASLVRFHREICPMVYTTGGGADMKEVQDLQLNLGDVWYTRSLGLVLLCQVIGAKLPEELGIGERGINLFWKLDGVLNIKFEGGA